MNVAVTHSLDECFPVIKALQRQPGLDLGPARSADIDMDVQLLNHICLLRSHTRDEGKLYTAKWILHSAYVRAFDHLKQVLNEECFRVRPTRIDDASSTVYIECSTALNEESDIS